MLPLLLKRENHSLHRGRPIRTWPAHNLELVHRETHLLLPSRYMGPDHVSRSRTLCIMLGIKFYLSLNHINICIQHYILHTFVSYSPTYPLSFLYSFRVSNSEPPKQNQCLESLVQTGSASCRLEGQQEYGPSQNKTRLVVTQKVCFNILNSSLNSLVNNSSDYLVHFEMKRKIIRSSNKAFP